MFSFGDFRILIITTLSLKIFQNHFFLPHDLCTEYYLICFCVLDNILEFPVVFFFCCSCRCSELFLRFICCIHYNRLAEMYSLFYMGLYLLLAVTFGPGSWIFFHFYSDFYAMSKWTFGLPFLPWVRIETRQLCRWC